MKISLRYLIVLMAILFTSSLNLYSYSGGISGRATIGCGGSGCHSQSANTTFQLNNLPSSINAGDKVDLILDVINSAQSKAGMNLIIVDGSGNNVGTITAGSGTTVTGGQLIHTTPKSISGDRASFSFSWTAPSTAGTYYVKAAGNAVNGNSNTSGDEWAIMSQASFSVVVPNGKITGQVTENGTGMPGVTITAGSKTATTDASGNYTISSLTNGNYTVSAAKAGYGFTPNSTNIVINNNTMTANFTGEKNSFNVSGKVTFNGTGLAAVSMKYGTSQSVQTDASGNYTILGVTKGTSITITPQKGGYEFTPANKQVMVNADVTGEDFTASVLSYKIRGTITLSGKGLQGVSVAWGTGKTPVLTNADGFYEISGVAPGTYTITPSLDGFAFTPTSLEVTVVQSNVSGKDFTAKQEKGSISGTVTKNGQALEGVRIDYKTASSAIMNTMTGADGKYQITGLDAETYELTPVLFGYEFTPAKQSVIVAKGQNVNGKDFTAKEKLYSITGTVSYDGDGLSDVTLTYASGKSVKSIADGSYKIENLLYGKHTVRPSKANYIFIPDSIEVSVDANMTNINFNAYLAKLANISNMMPANNATEVKPSESLSWNEVENATGYEFELKALDNSLNVVETLTSNMYSLSNIALGKSYTWKVRAVNEVSKVNGEWSPMYAFTAFEEAPDTIETLEPADNATNVNPDNIRLKWAALTGIDSYEVRIAKNAAFTDGLKEYAGLQNNEIEVDLDGSTKYFWQVRAFSGNNSGEWSLAKSFTTGIKVSVEDSETLVNNFDFKLSPNPVSNMANIRFTLRKAEQMTISILDLTGNKVYETGSQTWAEGQNTMNLSLESLNSGAYIALIQIGNSSYTYQIRIVK